MQERDAVRLRKRIEGTVRRFMAEQTLWPEGGRLLVAVSGGPDSTALLLILARLAKRRAASLVAAHFDHRLRDEEAGQAEREVVEKLAAATAVPLITGAGEVQGRAKQERLSIEEAARVERYEFLARAAREAGCISVATGHTASDQAETVLMHVLRGTGLSGLGGMGPLTAWPFGVHEGLSLIRPLLKVPREDTAAYCQASGVEPVEDQTNASTVFLRNRVRHELMPSLRTYNPQIEASLVRLADSARSDVGYLEGVAKGAIETHDGVVQVSRDLMACWPASLRRNGLRLALESAAGDGQGFEELHVAALERLVLEGRTGDRLDLPRGVRAELARTALELLPVGTPTREALPTEPVRLAIPGEMSFGPLMVSAKTSVPQGFTRGMASVELDCAMKAEVDAETLGSELEVRRWRPGDRFQPLGMTGTTKLQDFFVDAHVRRGERNAVPIFETERGIVWVGGLRIAEWARPHPGRPTVTLSYQLLED
jgi:tRNA(Ile)-lysidine synthase